MKTLVNTDHVASKLKRYPAKTARMWKWCGFKSLGEIKLWNQRWWPRNDHKHVKVNGLKSVNIFVVISWLPPLISQLFHSGLVGPQHLLQLACFIVSYSADSSGRAGYGRMMFQDLNYQFILLVTRDVRILNTSDWDIVVPRL